LDSLLLRGFGRAIGDESTFVQTYDRTKGYLEVIAKEWPLEEREAIESNSSFLLVLENDFAEFDPRRHQFAFLWLTSFGPHGSEERGQELTNVLLKIAQLTRDPNSDVFAYVRSVAERKASSNLPGAARLWRNLRGDAISAEDLTGAGADGASG